MEADITLEAASVPPGPLRMPVVFTSVILMLPKILNSPIQRLLPDCVTRILGDFLFDNLLRLVQEPSLMPEIAFACLPGRGTGIAELSATTVW